MADQILTPQRLINGDKDLQTIEDFMKIKDETITTRFGDEIMTMNGLQEEVKKSGGYFKRYTSLASANADIANIPVNSVVKVTDAVGGGDYEKVAAGATNLTRSPYDPVEQAKADATTKANAAQAAAITAAQADATTKANAAEANAKTFTKSTIDKSSQLNGWFDPNFTQLDMTNKNYFGRERFWGNFAGWSKVKNPTFDGYALRRADGYNDTTFGGFATYLDEINVVAGDAITAYISLVGAGSIVYSVARFYNAANSQVGANIVMQNVAGGGSLVVSATPNFLRTTLTVPVGAVKLVVYPYNLTGNIGFDVVSHWVAAGDQNKVSELPLFNSVHRKLIDQKIAEKKPQNYIAYKKVNHDTEKLGDATYSNILKMGGFYEPVENTGFINKLQCQIWKTTSSDVEVKIFVRNSAGGFTPASVPADRSLTILAADFPKAQSDLTINLDDPLYVEKGQFVFVLFRAVDGNALSIRRWLYDANTTPVRHGLPLSTTSDWNTTVANSNAATGYGQTSMLLAFESGEFEAKADAKNIRYKSTNVGDYLDNLVVPDPVSEPVSLILPSKIYATQGLESNIYFDNILAESAKDYLFDVFSTVGTHQNERWTLTPTTATNTAIDVAVYSKKGVLLDSKTTALIATLEAANAGTKNICVIGDSLVGGGVITQTLLDNSVSNPTKVNLIGTRGTGDNKHEGRGGWTITDYTSSGRVYYQFTVSGVIEEPAINAATYSYGGASLMVQETNLTGGAGTITCSLSSGTAPAAGLSGTLTKTNTSAGDASISFSNVQPISGNPFWFSGAVNFGQYLTANSLTTPDVVAIMLGTNDVFSQTTDVGASDIADLRLASLDALINSIKSVNSTIKVALMIPPPPADQDAFGRNYGSANTSWRHKRNILIWASRMIAKYDNQEANRVYLVASNVAVDTVNNYGTETVAVNARNSTTVKRQNNGVHPASSGYRQIADQLFACCKAI